MRAALLALATRHWFVLAVGVLAIVYTVLALSPSSYGEVFKLLGVDSSPSFGEMRQVRSDEYFVLTPFFQIAVRGHFATTDLISPYHETLKGFMALPILDWSLVFKPQLWGFWVLPPDYAFSAYWAFIIAAFVVGYYLLIGQLGASRPLAALAAITLLTSHFVQVWGTTNGPAFAFAPWPVIAFLLPVKWYWKALLVFWTACFWIFGLLYPPFIIAGAFALGVLVLAFRRDSLKIGNIVAAGLGLAAMAAVVFLYFGDLVAIMRNTVYPGSRDAAGGGFALDQLAAQLFPYFTTSQFAALRTDTNDCEISMVATMLPLLALFFLNYGELWRVIRSVPMQFVIWLIGLAMMLAWMLLPIPASIGRLLLWNEVQAIRMAWGLGLLLTLGLAVFVSRAGMVLTPLRILAFAATVVLAWGLSKIGYTEIWGGAQATAWQALSRSWFDLFVLVPLVAGAVAYWSLPWARANAPVVVMAIAAVTGAATYGTYNPVQSTHKIFDMPETPMMAKLKQFATRNANGWLVVQGMYGAAFNGVGIPSINHSLAVPQLAFFRRVFPDMPPDDFNAVFNRYANIAPEDNVVTPMTPSPDVAAVPSAAFDRPIPAGDVSP